MGSIPLFDADDNRAISPTVGLSLIIGFTVLTGVGLVVYGESVVTENQDPRITADFELEYTDTAEATLVYTTGDNFRPQDTARIFATGTGENGTQYTIEIYDGNSVVDRQFASPPSKLKPGLTAIGTERMKERNVSSGATVQVVWVPEEQQNSQIILAETIVPSRDRILQEVDADGTVSANGNVVVNGTDP